MYEAELVELYLLSQYQASHTECVPLTVVVLLVLILPIGCALDAPPL